MVLRENKSGTKTVTVVGAGGVIGSHLVKLVARMSMVGTMILIDPDRYENKNISSQNIVHSDIDKLKVVVLARDLAELDPSLEVKVFAERIENVPVGKLRADLLVSCLDSRSARQSVNRLAFRLGIPWVDGGVNAAEQLGRVNCYFSSPKATCYECSFEPEDYALLEQTYPCQQTPNVPATGAPAELGSLVASLQAIEIRKLLLGQDENALLGKQVLVELVHHRYFVTSIPWNPKCGFDHNSGLWTIHRISKGSTDLTLREALAMKPSVGDADRTSLCVDGHRFIRRLRCQDCGRKSRLLWILAHRLKEHHQICRHCHGKMVAGALDIVGEVSGSINPAWLDRPLGKLGLRNGDVITLTRFDNEYHIELGS